MNDPFGFDLFIILSIGFLDLIEAKVFQGLGGFDFHAFNLIGRCIAILRSKL